MEGEGDEFIWFLGECPEEHIEPTRGRVRARTAAELKEKVSERVGRRIARLRYWDEDFGEYVGLEESGFADVPRRKVKFRVVPGDVRCASEAETASQAASAVAASIDELVPSLNRLLADPTAAKDGASEIVRALKRDATTGEVLVRAGVLRPLVAALGRDDAGDEAAAAIGLLVRDDPLAARAFLAVPNSLTLAFRCLDRPDTDDGDAALTKVAVLLENVERHAPDDYVEAVRASSEHLLPHLVGCVLAEAVHDCRSLLVSLSAILVLNDDRTDEPAVNALRRGLERLLDYLEGYFYQFDSAEVRRAADDLKDRCFEALLRRVVSYDVDDGFVANKEKVLITLCAKEKDQPSDVVDIVARVLLKDQVEDTIESGSPDRIRASTLLLLAAVKHVERAFARGAVSGVNWDVARRVFRALETFVAKKEVLRVVAEFDVIPPLLKLPAAYDRQVVAFAASIITKLCTIDENEFRRDNLALVAAELSLIDRIVDDLNRSKKAAEKEAFIAALSCFSHDDKIYNYMRSVPVFLAVCDLVKRPWTNNTNRDALKLLNKFGEDDRARTAILAVEPKIGHSLRVLSDYADNPPDKAKAAECMKFFPPPKDVPTTPRDSGASTPKSPSYKNVHDAAKKPEDQQAAAAKRRAFFGRTGRK